MERFDLAARISCPPVKALLRYVLLPTADPHAGNQDPFHYNLVQTVCQLRWSRNRLIQTLDQFAF